MSNYMTPDEPDIWERVKRRVFPYRVCEVPDDVGPYEDMLTVKVRCDVPFLERVKLLVTGKMEVESRTICERAPGNCRTWSVVRMGRHNWP